MNGNRETRFVRPVALVGGMFLAACPAPSEPECFGSLAEYCEPETCVDFAGAVARAEEMRQVDEMLFDDCVYESECMSWASWSCGEIDVVNTKPGWFYEWTEYFDHGTGQLMAAKAYQDTNAYCEGASHGKSWALPGVVIDASCGYPDCLTGGSDADPDLCSY